MNKITPLVVSLILIASKVEAGFLGSQLAYNAGFSSPIPLAAEQHYGSPYGFSYGAPYATPLPVDPLSLHHPNAALGYSTPSVVRFRSSSSSSFGPFTSYPSVRSHHKFAFPAAVAAFYNAPAPVPSFYNAPAPVDFGSSPVTYSGFPAPNNVVKFGPPITTTTTTYSTTAAAAASVPLANPLNSIASW